MTAMRTLAWIIAVAPGCLASGASNPLEPECTTASYDCVSTLISARCLSCHSAALTGPARFDAPLGVDFDTEEDVRRWRDRIRIRSIDAPTMPPGAPLPEDERALLATYLDMLESLPCLPSCGTRVCGDDGCGGSCGTCRGTLVCNTREGRCSNTCTPDCSGRTCGDDGCGGSCGACPGGEA